MSGSHTFFAKASCAMPAQAATGAAPTSAAKRVGRNSVMAPMQRCHQQDRRRSRRSSEPPEGALMKSRLMIVSMMLAMRSTPGIGVLPKG